jgi:putative endonuclease
VDHGFEVIARNWRSRTGEIDLIARRGQLLVVCEVKARASAAFGSPAEAVTPAKQRRIRRLAAEWLATTGTHGVDVRFDVAAILGRSIDVIETAF